MNEKAELTLVRDLKVGDVQRTGDLITGFNYVEIVAIETIANYPRSFRITKKTASGATYQITEGKTARIVLVK